MDKLISASPNPNRTVIIAAKIAPDLLADNPHLWYGIDNMAAISRSITDALKKVDPADAASFDQNLAMFNASIQTIQQKMNDIKVKYSGTPVALTETIGLYQTQAMGLVVLTPLEFEKAIAEGNDPPADTVQTTNDQINKKMVKVLIYNGQTVTPITTNLLDAAKKLNIPEVYVTETMPAGKTYQSWMTDQLNALQKALEGGVQ
jgi:zinc/manganese transport system substrate-binding protein